MERRRLSVASGQLLAAVVAFVAVGLALLRLLHVALFAQRLSQLVVGEGSPL